MAKLTLSNITFGYATAAKLNNNFDAIEVALENTLSRNGDEPNQMQANLDMNSNRILNLPAPENLTEPLRLADLAGISIDTSSALPSQLNQGGEFLQSNGTVASWEPIEITDVQGLQDALDGKSDVGHTHVIADVTGLQAALDGKASTPIALDDLSDVTITTPSNTQVLKYNGSNWVNAANTASAAWGAITGTLSAQTDLQSALDAKQNLDATLTSLAAYNTNGLLTQTAADTFTGRTLTAGSVKLAVTNGSGVSGNPTVDLGTVTLDNLSDVIITTPSNGQVLKYNGSNWINNAESGSGGTAWGDITGTLSNQTDLNSALGGKQGLDATLTALAAYSTDGILTHTGVDTFTGRTLTAAGTKIVITNGNGVAGNPTINVGVLDAGDVTTGQFPTARVADSAITYDKIRNLAATNRVLGRITAGVGIVEELTPANLVTIITAADGTGSGLDSDTVDGIHAAGFVQTSRVITSGNGLTGGGDLSADRTLAVGAGTGITVAADTVGLDTANTRNVDHSAVSVATQFSLTGGGTIDATRTLNLVNDVSSPGNSKVYGTNSSGVRGWQSTILTAVSKIVDTSISSNSSSLIADPELILAIEANATYEVDIFLRFVTSGAGAGGLKFRLTGPAGCDTTGTATIYNQGVSNSVSGWNSIGTIVNTASNTTSSAQGISAKAVLINGGTAGNLGIQWCQSSSSAVATVLKVGSFISFRKLT